MNFLAFSRLVALFLGTSRDKPYRMPVGNLGTMDMTPIAVQNYHQQHLDGLVCLGGDGTQKNALYLAKEGLNIITLPKTIDNDVAGTDVTFGFDTAMSIATEAIDRLAFHCRKPSSRDCRRGDGAYCRLVDIGCGYRWWR